MAEFHSFYGSIIFHCIFIPHLPYPLICWWTPGLLPYCGYGKQCCCEHWGAWYFIQISGLLILDNSLMIVNTSALDTELEKDKEQVHLTTGSQRVLLSAELLWRGHQLHRDNLSWSFVTLPVSQRDVSGRIISAQFYGALRWMLQSLPLGGCRLSASSFSRKSQPPFSHVTFKQIKNIHYHGPPLSCPL